MVQNQTNKKAKNCRNKSWNRQKDSNEKTKIGSTKRQDKNKSKNRQKREREGEGERERERERDDIKSWLDGGRIPKWNLFIQKSSSQF